MTSGTGVSVAISQPVRIKFLGSPLPGLLECLVGQLLQPIR
jgi:hypothetical protein